MSSNAIAAAISASPITVVAIAPAPSASRSPARKWLEDRQAELLHGVEYFHVVFTVPEPIAAIAYQNKTLLYDLLFHASAETLRTIAADPQHLGAEIGFISILHTWGQQLLHHPHVHCVVPGGGLAPDGEHWIACRPGFFLPVRVLSRLFRRLFLEQLHRAFRAGELHFYSQLEPLRDAHAFATYLAPAAQAEWVVYAKPPFGGAHHVLDYLARYTHRVAISNNRLLSFSDGRVSFLWKDYQHGAAKKTMTLAADEFIRRFLLHVPPAGFQHIRHYGFLANRYRETKLAHCRQLLHQPPPSRRASRAAGGLSRPVPEAHRPILTRLPALRQGTHAGDRHLPRRGTLTRAPAGHFVMLRFLSHRRLPSSAAFPTAPAVLRALAPFTKTACISTSQRPRNPRANRDPQSGHRCDIVGTAPTHLAPIPIRPIALIQFP